MNAMAHAVESLYGGGHQSGGRDARGGIDPPARRKPARASCRTRAPSDPRTDALYGAWLAAAFRATTCVEHVIAQSLRQRFDLDHAHAHAVAAALCRRLQPDAAPAAMAQIERALGVPDAARGIYELNVKLGLPTGLKDIGMAQENITAAVDSIARIKYFNPRPVGAEDVREIIAQAFAGGPPRF